ncbi:LysE family translocator [Xanthomarina gelatinilytica]|uniref:LysE family translocator n=1 Tax=Xanthomarina gelatinilytica TaxID=1137281 RepID=UPI003AA89DFB
MLGIENFVSFLIAGLFLNLTPGTDTFYILGRSLSNGKKSGYLSAIGIGTGSLIHTLFAAFGLSIILKESELAFGIVKLMGAAYLIFLGIRYLIKKENLDIKRKYTKKNNLKLFLSGVLTNVFNPKVALFYLAFLPQFIDPNYPEPMFSFIVLGLTFTITGTLWGIILAMFSSRLSRKFINNPKIKIWFERITGLVFISLGIKLAISKLE